jgi:hypothetical protein
LQQVFVERLQLPPQSRTVAPLLVPELEPLLLPLLELELDPLLLPLLELELLAPESSLLPSSPSDGVELLLQAEAAVRTTAVALKKKGPVHRVS